jgi:predicted small lipoprotein YifL
MDSRFTTRLGLAALLACAMTACGQKGDLYLPDAPPEVVTRPAPASGTSDTTEAPNSPQTVDSPVGASTPAPEVTAPVGTPDAEDPEKEKNTAPPPPPRN